MLVFTRGGWRNIFHDKYPPSRPNHNVFSWLPENKSLNLLEEPTNLLFWCTMRFLSLISSSSGNDTWYSPLNTCWVGLNQVSIQRKGWKQPQDTTFSSSISEEGECEVSVMVQCSQISRPLPGELPPLHLIICSLQQKSVALAEVLMDGRFGRFWVEVILQLHTHCFRVIELLLELTNSSELLREKNSYPFSL